MIRAALPKGRLGKKVYQKLAAAGYPCPSIEEDSRQLTFVNPEAGILYFWAKPSDVGTYVERGIADIGVAGSDILEEYRPDVYELLDTGLGKCRMCVAGPKDFYDDAERRLVVATKFPHVASRYYDSIGRDIEIIKLNGSIEIAPVLGMSDVIVDLVETGKTLKENDLVVLKEIFPVSARLIANKVSWQFEHEAILKLRDAMEGIGND